VHHRTLGDKIIDSINVTLLAIISIIMLIPFLYIFSVSFTSFESFYLAGGVVFWPDLIADNAACAFPPFEPNCTSR
jgi:putative aldouronate transport system permease protein